jgi:hypothetical protein
VQAKFLEVDGQRFHIRGVSYGTFAESAPGVPFPPPEVVRQDFAMMRAISLNTVRLYDVPPTWLLDLAAEAGLRVILGVPWPQHLCLDRAGRREVVQQVHRVARTYGRHPAVLMCCVGNEIPTQVMRWYGALLVHRGQYGRRLLQEILKRLWAGIPVLIFPEGGRTHVPGMRRAWAGAAYLVARSGVPVVPVGVTGTEAVTQAWRRGRRPCLSMRIGSPIELPPVELRSAGRKQALEANTQILMRAVAALLPKSSRGVYDYE